MKSAASVMIEVSCSEVVDAEGPCATDDKKKAEDMELLAWLDMQIIFPDFTRGLISLAHQASWLQGQRTGLQAKLQSFLLESPSGLLDLFGKQCSKAETLVSEA